MYIYFAIVSFIIGASLGSFFNVCIYRIPNKKSVVNPPSHCYNCNTRLKPLDLVPILSWTLLRGKCRYCGQKISPRYALVELLTGILFVLVYSVYGPSIMTLYYSLLVSLLVIITFIDLDHYIIPDELIIFGSLGAVIFNILGQGISIKDSLLGGLICGGGMLVLIYLIELIIKKEVMGGGDIKMMTYISFILGWKLSIVVIFMASFLALPISIINVYRKDEHMLPFGPYLAVAALILFLLKVDFSTILSLLY